MRRILTILVTTVFLLVIVACGADDDPDEETAAQEPRPTEEISPTSEPSPTAEPTATEQPEPEPTKTPTADVTATDEGDDAPVNDDGQDLGEDDGALDDDNFGEGNDSFGTVPDVFLEDFHDPALGNLLLSSEQLPDGWEVIVEGSLSEDAEATHGLGDLMSGPCGKDLLTPERMGYPVHVGRIFMGPDFGPFLSQDLYEFEDENQAAEAMVTASDQLDCDDWTAEDPMSGMEMKYTVEELDFPDLGDETLAFSLSIGVASDVQAGVQQVQHQTQFDDLYGDMSAQLVMVRQGTRFSSFTYMNWFGHNDIDLEETVSLAVERVENGE